jgi:hypothetical protein
VNEIEIESRLLPHLEGQFERALPILFIGAGFSLAATNITGTPVPAYSDLRNALWDVCFPGNTMEDSSSLQDLYEHARLRHPRELKDLLNRLLTVDAEAVPEWYSEILSMPWYRCYTLNIDDLLTATSRRYTLPRAVDPISATRIASPEAGVTASGRELEAVHLNGTLEDVPDHVTFSLTQYAERLARQEPWYLRLAADLVSHPFVFIGTRLDEPPLWQHVELRRARGRRGLRELRPRSYLVTDHLDLARRALLAEFNIDWVPMTAEAFTKNVLARLKSAGRQGMALLKARTAVTSVTADVPEVAHLASAPQQSTDFLVGAQPVWADLQAGRAIGRDCDDGIWSSAIQMLKRSGPKGLIVITGTAGSGKSTSLMRLCLRLVADGVHVGWLDDFTEMTPRDIRRAMKSAGAPAVLAIDDADIYGLELSPLIRELLVSPTCPLVLAGIRSGRVDRVINPVRLEGIAFSEIAMPPLADPDIGLLLDTLDRENRLGILKGKPRLEQEKAFREQAGRQLLVAMIQATSDRRFEEKAVSELLELPETSQRIYVLVAVATSFRIGLSRDEILIASGDSSNESLNAIDQLTRRHIISVGGDGSLRARHRVIAEVIRDEVQKIGVLEPAISGLALVAATKVDPTLARSARPWRILRHVINHEFLNRALGLEPARNVFGSLEQLLTWDFHYWLQRGSLEVEFGDLRLAEQFLNQARGLAANEVRVENEWAYLLFRKAIENAHSLDAPLWVGEATEILFDLMNRVGDAYPYHVLGSQGLAWARRGLSNSAERERYLKGLQIRIEEGCGKYPRAQDLKQLLGDVTREYLGIAVGH